MGYRSFGSYFDRQKFFLFYLGIFITETCSEPPKNLFIFLIWRPSQHWVFTDQIKIRVSDWPRPPPLFGTNPKFLGFFLRVPLDNMTARAYIRKMGGTRSRTLCTESQTLEGSLSEEGNSEAAILARIGRECSGR